MKQFIICPECRSFELAQIESRVPARWDFYRCTKCRQLIPGDERLLAKAISIKQPWSFLIASGIKDVENRTWQTKFRGRVLLHAGAKRQTGILDLLDYPRCREIRRGDSYCLCLLLWYLEHLERWK